MLCYNFRCLLHPYNRALFASIAFATLFVAGQSRASDRDHNPPVGTWRPAVAGAIAGM